MSRALYERAYGSKYQFDGWHSAADIAKLIRADIKAAIKAGDLPGSAKNYSVRSRSYSGGQAIDIVAKGLDGLYQQCEGIKPGSEKDLGSGYVAAQSCGRDWCKAGGQYKDLPNASYHRIQTVEGQRIDKLLNDIHWAYNHDGSESQVDYFDRRYWGHAQIEDPERGW